MVAMQMLEITSLDSKKYLLWDKMEIKTKETSSISNYITKMIIYLNIMVRIRKEIQEGESKDPWLRKNNQRSKELGKWKGEKGCCTIY